MAYTLELLFYFHFLENVQLEYMYNQYDATVTIHINCMKLCWPLRSINAIQSNVHELRKVV